MEALLPHRPPMILIDRLVDAQEAESTCEVTITPRTLFLESAGVPAYVGLEYMAQAIAAHGGYTSYRAGEPIALGFLLGTPRWQSWCRYFTVGQTLWIHVAHVWGDNEFLRFHCTITDTTTTALLQQADLNVFKPKKLHVYLNEVADEKKGARDRR
jgi:predicted hotdog family 3-hydroxylacyl-ACP dehydratase